jgi:hypothetical protein
MENQMHLASQYLAAAGISFVEKQEDDSHTNLGFNTEKGIMYTRALSDNGDQLILNYNTFSLDWRGLHKTSSVSLDGKTHKAIMDWISNSAQKAIGKPYKYAFHYNLPYTISDDFIFELKDANRLNELLKNRTLAYSIIEEFLAINNLESEIRVWPHHFDTGAFVLFENDSGLSIGLGFTIPDAVAQDHYFYIGGYKGHDGIDTSNFKELTHGQWSNKGFIGAILSISKTNKTKGVNFFNEVLSAYLTQN